MHGGKRPAERESPQMADFVEKLFSQQPSLILDLADASVEGRAETLPLITSIALKAFQSRRKMHQATLLFVIAPRRKFRCLWISEFLNEIRPLQPQ
jgi:hypothetical protein